ncbi:hypothetical protein Taro_004891 [Colocasia esculenta]|uniref:Uncharacterized protein n=1 Tax=Colocasia esculenta TaxID=4460 RepID=A0A843TSZ5_COLES|nr:hypothetical protein [Colocasia esculenta]
MAMESTATTILNGSSSSTAETAVGIAQVENAVDPMDLRKGPWTAEEDLLLVNYIAVHGDGRWNSLARSAGLKRSGKSCRLRWLNYLRPDVRRGNFSPEEQLLILELHCRWGNRWSKIAQHLPGRTDNEIKNYWRTRVQKHAKQLKCDVNSRQFRDAVHYLWIPRLMEKIQAASANSAASYGEAASVTVSPVDVTDSYVVPTTTAEPVHNMVGNIADVTELSRDNSSTAATSSESSGDTSWWSSPSVSDVLADCYLVQASTSSDYGTDELPAGPMVSSFSESLLGPCGFQQGFPDFAQNVWGADGAIATENFWTDDDIWFLQ